MSIFVNIMIIIPPNIIKSLMINEPNVPNILIQPSQLSCNPSMFNTTESIPINKHAKPIMYEIPLFIII